MPTPAPSRPSSDRRDPLHVVVVGAGLGGLALARGLTDKPVEVTVVDRHNYHLFQPLLYQVATASLEPQAFARSLRQIFRDWDDVNFRHGAAAASTWRRGWSTRRRTAARLRPPGGRGGRRDQVLGMDGGSQRTYPLKRLDHAADLRDRVLPLFDGRRPTRRRSGGA